MKHPVSLYQSLLVLSELRKKRPQVNHKVYNLIKAL